MKKTIVYMLLLCFGMVLVGSCAGPRKGCGCGADINRVNNNRSRHLF
ncbi:MAG: hypothetical protein JSS82_16970 [Bacteroidetes bacterium]|nr:hypothetical protein [Bacteroidota bacterium]